MYDAWIKLVHDFNWPFLVFTNAIAYFDKLMYLQMLWLKLNGYCWVNAILMHISKVCVADVDEVKGQETAKEFCSTFGKDSAFFVKCDVTKKDEYESKKCQRLPPISSHCVWYARYYFIVRIVYDLKVTSVRNSLSLNVYQYLTSQFTPLIEKKMAAISQTTSSNACIFMNEKFCVSIKITPKFVPKGPNDNKSLLVQVMAWYRIGDNSLPEPMLTQFADAYMRHKGRWVKIYYIMNYIYSRQNICSRQTQCHKSIHRFGNIKLVYYHVVWWAQLDLISTTGLSRSISMVTFYI